MPRLVHSLTLLVLALTPLSCGDDTTGTVAVAYVVISPADTTLAPGDSLQLTATAFNTAGEPIPGMTFSWSTSNAGALSVDGRGMVRAFAAGDARVEAREPGPVRGFADIRVRQISAFAPVHGAFGEIVELRGQGFHPGMRLLFDNEEAFLRSVAPDGRSLQAWVPVGATTGPLWVTTGVYEEETGQTFFVTGGGEDALEPNGLEMPRPIEFPFHNPSLVARPGFTDRDRDLYEFTLPEDGPVHLQIDDRSPAVDRLHATRAEIWDVALDEIVALAATVAWLPDSPLRPLHVSLPRLNRGTHHVLVTPFAFVGGFSEIAAGDRSYGMHLDRNVIYDLEPDDYEPNEYPAIATALTYPQSITARIETPWAADYYAFELSSPTAVRIELRTPGGTIFDSDFDLFVMSDPSKSVPYVIATGQVPELFAFSAGDSSVETLTGLLDPGRYYVAVLDAGGKPFTYTLAILPFAAAGAELAALGAASIPAETVKLWAGSAFPAHGRMSPGDGR